MPDAGAISICWRCHKLGIYTDTETIRKPTDEELADLMKDPWVRDCLNVVMKSSSPLQAADILGHAQKWQATHLRTDTGDSHE